MIRAGSKRGNEIAIQMMANIRSGKPKWIGIRNKELQRLNELKFRRSYPEVGRSNSAFRRATKLKATPIWADRFLISEYYHLAYIRTKVTGIPWDVDHIVPLLSDSVCGLHTEDNIQTIPRMLNISKSNRYIKRFFWPDFFSCIKLGH